MNDIQFPQITVGGRTLTVRYSIAAQVLMKRRGIDLKRLLDPEKDVVGNMLTVFSCLVAEEFVDQSNPDKYDLDKAPTADYWAHLLHPLQFPEVEAAIVEAVGKVAEEQRKLRPVAVPPAVEATGAKALAN